MFRSRRSSREQQSSSPNCSLLSRASPPARAWPTRSSKPRALPWGEIHDDRIAELDARGMVWDARRPPGLAITRCDGTRAPRTRGRKNDLVLIVVVQVTRCASQPSARPVASWPHSWHVMSGSCTTWWASVSGRNGHVQPSYIQSRPSRLRPQPRFNVPSSAQLASGPVFVTTFVPLRWPPRWCLDTCDGWRPSARGRRLSTG